jgi:shikimate kinase
LIKRIFNDINRPLRLKSGLFEKRHSCYNSIANIVISCDFKSIEDVADEILLRIKFKEKE